MSCSVFQVSLSLRLKGKFVYSGGVLRNMVCCIGQLCCSSTMLYNITNIAYNHHLSNLQTYKYIYLRVYSVYPKASGRVRHDRDSQVVGGLVRQLHNRYGARCWHRDPLLPVRYHGFIPPCCLPGGVLLFA